MQIEIDFQELFEYPSETVAIVWLKRHRWVALFDWKRDRQLERSRRIVRKLFPDGISQADFMKVKTI